MKIYSLYDKVSTKHLSVTLAQTDADFIRSSLYAILMDYPIQDVIAYCVGEFYEDSGIIIPCCPRSIDWDSYKFPKSADSLSEDYLTFEELRNHALSKKQKFNELEKDKIEDLKKLADDVTLAIKDEKLSDTDKDKLIDYRKQLLETIKIKEDKLNG